MQGIALADYVFPTYGESYSTAAYLGGLDKPNRFSISPLFGKAQMKQGTVKEKGWLYGVKGNYDLINPNCFYFGAEIGYKAGDLKGNGDATFTTVNIVDPATRVETPTAILVEEKTKSKYSDLWGEIRVGFTLANFGLSNSFISPYFVVGAEREKDYFVSPTTLEIKHKIEYGYLGCGAVSSFILSPCLSLGLNVKFKWMFNSHASTSGSPDIKEKGISPANHFHWYIEAPLTWAIAPNMSLGIAPFYEYKNYERHKHELLGKEKATFQMYGGLIQLAYAF
jgi:hypothetical protein